MSTSRKRNPLAIAGRLTAVTLSVALLAGCTGARFMMGGDPAPVNPTGTSAVPNATATMVKINGKASLLGVPMAKATVKVFDALTNAPAAVVAAGGGNVIAAGGANFVVLQAQARPTFQVGAEALTTDDKGNFTLQLGNFKPGMAARVAVSVGDKTVTTLVTGSGTTLDSAEPAAYAVAQVTSNQINGTFLFGQQMRANETTHVATQMTWGAMRMGGTLNPNQAANVIEQVVRQTITTVIPVVQVQIRQDPASINSFLQVDPIGRTQNLSDLNTFARTANLTNPVDNLINNTRQSVAQLAQDPRNVAQTLTLTNNDLAGSNIQVGLANGQLTFTNTLTGETNTITLPTVGGDTNNPPTTQEPSTQEPTQQETSAGPNETQVDINNPGAFNPTVTVSGNLTVTVQQPSGTDDISAIYARIPTAGTTLTAANIASQTSGNITAGPQAAALTVAVDNAPDADGNLPPRFASAPLSGRVFAGHLMRGTQKVATFRVYTMGSFHYLVTKYLLTDSVKTNGGHTTSVTTTAITGVATGTKAEITLVSRNGNFANIEKNTQ